MTERSFDGLINPLVFFVSVIQEGRAIVDSLGLEVVGDQTLELYSHPRLPLHLVVMGIGRDAAQAAVSYASTRWGTGSTTWVNFGIAGHRDHALGTLHQVVELSADGEGENEIVLGPVLSTMPQAHLMTFTHFVGIRPPVHLCDMEAYWIARASAELCPDVSLYVFKVVSDNEMDNLLLSDVGKRELAAHLERHAQNVLERLYDALITG